VARDGGERKERETPTPDAWRTSAEGEAAGVCGGMLGGQRGRCNTLARAFVEVPVAYYILF